MTANRVKVKLKPKLAEKAIITLNFEAFYVFIVIYYREYEPARVLEL